MSPISPERVASNALLAQWCAPITGAVLSIGSGGDIDKQGRCYREYFPRATRYVTSDIDPSMRADLVLDARAMGLDSGSFDAIFCSGVLEHVDDVAAVAAECHRILTPHGVLLLGLPFKQPVHRAPGDFWRFTEFGARYLLRAFTVNEVQPIGDPAFPFGYWLRARKGSA